MICILLVAGHGTHLEREIKSDASGKYASLRGVPKALLPGVGGKKILDYWWDAVNTRQLFSEVYLVTNADKYKYFERWATANDFPVDNIVNDGTTTYDGRLGSVGDFDLVLRTKRITDDVMLVAGDMLFQDHKFDILQVVHYFKKKKPGELAIYYEMEETESSTTRGIVEVCPATNRITHFYEKPNEGDTDSRLASVVFYCFQRATLSSVPDYLSNHPDVNQRNFGNYMQWLVNESDLPVYGMKLPTGFQLIGHVTLANYEKWLTYFSDKKSNQKTLQPYTAKAYARVGVMGNPSDMFNGKTISLSISNFWAEVTIIESRDLVLVPHPLNDLTEFGSLGDLHVVSPKEGYFGGLRLFKDPLHDGYLGTCPSPAQRPIRVWEPREPHVVCRKEGYFEVLVPHPLNDPTEFGSLGDLHVVSRKEGYFGGLRLLQATCKKFYQYCSEQGIALPKRNFTLKYDTNIPRQVGLAGSSAIVTAALRCLMYFFDITDMDMQLPLQPQFILDVEMEELFIVAGLQDRVIQVYEGLVHMDFSASVLLEHGHGSYETMDVSLLPPLWLGYIRNPSDSGKIHNNIEERWKNGDSEIIEGMQQFGRLTTQARQALEARDYGKFKELMDKNFDLRRKLYGDDVIGAQNLRMVEIARQHGSSAKFSGSGGAVIGYCPDQENLTNLKRAFQSEGFVYCDIVPKISEAARGGRVSQQK